MGFTITEHLTISMADGVRLAARLWLPGSAGKAPVGAILEYIPYRKRDGTRGRDEPMHGWFAANGFAVLRVDMRGSGDSEGLMDDEYLPVEHQDACTVIAWLAAQPWCNGRVAMMGKSWGGFNSLQVAALRPPALSAVLTVCSTDDRYADDIHWMGGCLLNDNHWWGAIMLAYQCRPPDPALFGEGWRDEWAKRIAHLPFFPAIWARRPLRDDYWKQGSVCEDFSAITVPVFAVGGWADAYTNAVPRLLAGLKGKRIGLIGPWAHVYPQDGTPAPAIGFLQEAKRFFDAFLHDRNTGIMDGPMLRAWIEDGAPPSTTRAKAPGRWVGEAAWPSPRIRWQTWHFGPGALKRRAQGPARLSIRSPLYAGASMGEWMGTGVPGEAPADQRLDDGWSLVFDTEPIERGFDVLGAPVLRLMVESDTPSAQIAIRLSEVAPDGAATRVSYGVLNLTHRNGHEAAEPMPRGRAVPVRLQLNDCGHAFTAGNRIRVSVMSACWPLIWPAPGLATLTLHLADCSLDLPVRPRGAGDADIAFEPPASAPPAPVERIASSRLERRFALDLLNDTARSTTIGEGGLFGEGVLRFTDIDTTVSHSLNRAFEIAGADPASAKSRIDQIYELGRDGWRIRIETVTEMTSDAAHFHMSGRVRVLENGALFAERHLDECILRGL
jgi:putative CocE/NonD family hydrolase